MRLGRPCNSSFVTAAISSRNQRLCAARSASTSTPPTLAWLTSESKFWESQSAWHLLRHFDSAAALLAAGKQGLDRSLRQAGIQFHRKTLDPILEWAAQAAPPDVAAARHRAIA